MVEQPLSIHPRRTELTRCSLPRNQVPEWAASYIDYKGLKKLVKAAAAKAKADGQEPVDLAGGNSSGSSAGD